MSPPEGGGVAPSGGRVQFLSVDEKKAVLDKFNELDLFPTHGDATEEQYYLLFQRLGNKENFKKFFGLVYPSTPQVAPVGGAAAAGVADAEEGGGGAGRVYHNTDMTICDTVRGLAWISILSPIVTAITSWVIYWTPENEKINTAAFVGAVPTSLWSLMIVLLLWWNQSFRCLLCGYCDDPDQDENYGCLQYILKKIERRPRSQGARGSRGHRDNAVPASATVDPPPGALQHEALQHSVDILSKSSKEEAEENIMRYAPPEADQEDCGAQRSGSPSLLPSVFGLASSESSKVEVPSVEARRAVSNL
eukprot:GDKH01014650.1.p1 GENE.GDKH01014650.1~~GDKH01014650.1.p1  ORF type:complete len:306 (-),score=16.32 GDKH01014650.1:71-988(-)